MHVSGERALLGRNLTLHIAGRGRQIAANSEFVDDDQRERGIHSGKRLQSEVRGMMPGEWPRQSNDKPFAVFARRENGRSLPRRLERRSRFAPRIGFQSLPDGASRR
jgi:hypothetical protein